VTGLYIATEFSEYGAGIFEKAGFADRISLLEASMASNPFDDDTSPNT
jgi:hypothetical protein